MKQKLIFLDIDGTLTLPGTLQPPESAVDAIRRAQANGHKVFLCTGRCLGRFQPLMELGFDGAVGSAGAYVGCGGEVLYDHPMTREKLERVLEVVTGAGLAQIIETRDGGYAAERAVQLLAGARAAKFPGSELARLYAEMRSSNGFRPLEKYGGDPVYKVVFVGEDPSAVGKVDAALGGEFVLCLHNIFQKSGFVHGELIDRAFDKGSGIRAICHHLRVDVADAVGFGDSMNDRAMLETVGVSVCMGNGVQAMKDLSDLVCPCVTEDGLAWGFRKLRLI